MQKQAALYKVDLIRVFLFSIPVKFLYIANAAILRMVKLVQALCLHAFKCCTFTIFYYLTDTDTDAPKAVRKCRVTVVRSPSLCLLAGPPRFFQIEIEVYLYTTLIASHPYYPLSVC